MTQPTCAQCGNDLPPSRTRPRKFCTKRCSRRASQQRQREHCAATGCQRPRWAKGLCSSHYATQWRNTRGPRARDGEKVTRTCITCGTEWRTTRKDAKFCSDKCKGQNYQTRCKLPDDHPVRLEIARQKEAAKATRSTPDYSWRTPRQCPGCASWFTPLYTPTAVTCTPRCARRCQNRRRRAREHDAAGTWTWAEFMRIARRFNYCCAYCGTKPDRLDPDHVVALSQGGANTPSNLLPTCAECNSSKNAMSLTQWAEWRAARGLEPRTTTWTVGDPRYVHLTEAALHAA